MSVITGKQCCCQYEAKWHQHDRYVQWVALLGNYCLCMECLENNYRPRTSRTCHRCKLFVRDVPLGIFRISSTKAKVAICQRCIDEAIEDLRSAEIMESL